MLDRGATRLNVCKAVCLAMRIGRTIGGCNTELRSGVHEKSLSLPTSPHSPYSPPMEQKSPIAFLIAVVAAGSVIPVVALMDAIYQQGGDGLGGAGAMMLFMIAAIVLTAGGVIMGFRRREKFAWLSYVALALWGLPVVVLMA